MIVSHRLKYIFFHVPKTAGTSIAKILLNRPFMPDTIGKWEGMPKHKLKEKPLMDWNLKQHSTVEQARQYFEEHTNYNFDEYFKFAFIRNPWDRQVSIYEYYMQSVLNQKNPSYKNVELAHKYKDEPATKFLTEVVSPTQSDFICDQQGNLGVHFVGKFENIKEDLKAIVSNIMPGLSAQAWNLEHLNKTKRKPYQEYFDKESELAIAETHKKDIELGGYTF